MFLHPGEYYPVSTRGISYETKQRWVVILIIMIIVALNVIGASHRVASQRVPEEDNRAAAATGAMTSPFIFCNTRRTKTSLRNYRGRTMARGMVE